MAIARRKNLRRDESGAVMLEFTIVAGVMMTVLFGIVEFSNLFSQWNAATKAVQAGVRVAASSDPVWSDITALTGLENGDLPGDALDAASGYGYKITCSGATATCGGGPGDFNTIVGCCATNYDPNAMARIVSGRGSLTCGDPPGTYFGMCDVFQRIRTQNVQIIYQHTNTGYASRPGGLVPTITVQIIGLNFQFIFLDDIMGIFGNPNLNQIAIPGLTSTLIAEDMRSGAPSF